MTTPPLNPDEQTSSSKTIAIVAASLGAVVIIALTVFAVFFFAAPETTPETNEQSKTVDTSLVPVVKDFTVTQDKTKELEATYSFTVPSFENKIVEYRVEDNQLNSLDSGSTVKPGVVTNKVLLKKNSTSVILNVRVVVGKKASTWVNMGSVPVKIVGTGDTGERPVNPDFYETPWALKEDVSVEALQEAFQVAFNAQAVQPSDYDKCYIGNTAELLPGEIIRPRPELGSQYDLKTLISQPGSEKFVVDFVWCEK